MRIHPANCPAASVLNNAATSATDAAQSGAQDLAAVSAQDAITIQDPSPTIPSPATVPQGWLPIATAPKDGSYVLILFDSATVDVVRLCCWDDGGPRPWEVDPTKPRPDDVGWWSYKHSVTQEKIEHMTPIAWMPMPDCPASFYPYPR